jgi:Flp pilus assembly pilin Flp
MFDNVTRTWWYEQSGQQAGPVTTQTIHGLLVSGALSPANRVWRNGLADWMPIQHVPDLAPALQAAATARQQPGGSLPAQQQPPPSSVPAPAYPQAMAPQGFGAPVAYGPPAGAVPFQEVSVASVILLSVVTLGIYGMVKFYQTGKAYERLAGRESKFTLYFWLYIGFAVASGAHWVFGIGSLVFGVLTLFEALAVRDEGLRRWNIAAQVTEASTHKTYYILATVLSVVLIGLVFMIIQAVKWFEDWNAIGKAAQGRLA